MMNRHLIVAVVVAAVSAPAMARNVTIYGLIDASHGHYGNYATGSVTGFQDSVWASNRIGIRGTEALGGGLRIGFVIESGFRTDIVDPTVTAANPTGAGTFDFGSRGTELFLNGGFGQVRMGKAATSDLIAVGSGYFWNVSNFRTTLTGGRPANRLQYLTPTLAGFRANVAVATGGRDAIEGDTPAGATTTKADGYRNVGFSYAATRVSMRVFHAELNTYEGDVRTRNQDIGASARYDFGVANVGVRYVASERKRGGSTRVDAVRYAIEARIPVGAVGFVASYLHGDDRTASNADYRQISIGADYALSKRTAAYVLFSRTDNSVGAARSAISVGAPIGTIADGADPTAFVIGLRHRF
jgi:predicted porin